MVHHVADLAVEVAGDLHDLRGLAADVGHPERGGGAEAGLLLRHWIEVGQRLADRRREVAAIEVPLAGDLGTGRAAHDDAEVPGVGAADAGGILELEADRVVLLGPRRVGRVAQRDLAAGLGERLRHDLGAVEVERDAGRRDCGVTIDDHGLDRSGGAVAVRSRCRTGLGDVRPLRRGDAGRAVGLHGGGLGRAVDQGADAVGGDGVEVQVGAVTGLPVDDAERVDARRGGVDRPDRLVVLVGRERLDRHAAVVRGDLRAEVVARIGRYEDLEPVVVVHVGAVRAGADAEGRDALGQLEEADDLGREVQGVRAAARDAGERLGREAGDDVAVDVEQVERGGVLLEVHRVRGVAAVRVRARDRFVRDGRAGGGGQRAVDLLQGADQVVGDGGVLRRLRRADDEAARRACARWQGGGCGQRVGRGIHSCESGARQQREC